MSICIIYLSGAGGLQHGELRRVSQHLNGLRWGPQGDVGHLSGHGRPWGTGAPSRKSHGHHGPPIDFLDSPNLIHGFFWTILLWITLKWIFLWFFSGFHGFFLLWYLWRISVQTAGETADLHGAWSRSVSRLVSRSNKPGTLLTWNLKFVLQ
jgi:hypothetical protein